MATGYQDSEIEAAVAKYVRGEVRTQNSLLGPTDMGNKFSEVVALISSSLIFDPNAIFYLIYLASNRLNANVLTVLSYLDDLLQAIVEMLKKTQDVTNTTLLGDAAAALLTVDQILTDKSALSSQAYSRYQSSVSRFVDVSLKKNIKEGSSIVRTPQEARTAAKGLLKDISPLYKAILEDATQLQLELSDFLSLNLPVLAVQDSVRKVRYDLQTLQGSFESRATKDDRISMCRSAFLTIVAGKSVLDNYTTVSDPSDVRLSSSTSMVGRIATPLGEGELVPAEVETGLSAPWPLVTGSSDELEIGEDGNTVTVYTIPVPAQAQVRSYAPAPYTIVMGVNDILEIDELGIVITLTAGVGRTAAQIVSDINTWAVANYPGVYLAAVLSEVGQDYVQITKTQDGLQKITLTAIGYPASTIVAYGTLGFYDGQSDSSAGVSGDELADAINVVGSITASVNRTFFEEGKTGDVTSPTVIDLPLDSLGSLAHVGDQLIIRSGVNSGYHKIDSIARVTEDRVTVSSATPFLAVATGQSWQVYRERVKTRSESSGIDSQLAVSSGSANALLGLTTGNVYGTTTGFRVADTGTDVDFSRYDVALGDILYVTIGTTVTQHAVVEIPDPKQLELAPPINTTSTLAAFQIISSAAVSHEEFIAAMALWDSLVVDSAFDSDILPLERVMNPLLANPHPSLAQRNDAVDSAEVLQGLLTDLSEVLVAFKVSAVGRIDAALKMLQERGMDRAYDQLMKGEIAGFFGMDKDDAASSSYMLKTMRSVVQNDLPTSKVEDDVDDTSLLISTTGTDAELDFSDNDRDENIKILGDVPDFDNPADEAATRSRY